MSELSQASSTPVSSYFDWMLNHLLLFFLPKRLKVLHRISCLYPLLFSLKMKLSLYQQAEVPIALIAIPFLLFVLFKADRNKTQNEQEVTFFQNMTLCL